MSTITQLEYLQALAQHRHYGKAAKAKNVTQPTLSMQIQKLEEDMGLTLIDRSKSPIELTMEGQAILEQAEVVLREHKKLEDIAQTGLNGVLRGTFKVAIIPTIATYLVPYFAREFAELYPHVELTLKELTTEEIIKSLKNDTIDLGILATPLKLQTITEIPLYYEPFHLFISEHHPLFNKSEINQKDLKLEEMWLLSEGNCFRDQVLNICKQKLDIKKGINKKISYEAASFETLKQMALNSKSYTLIPSMDKIRMEKEGLKRVKDFIGIPPVREISIVHSPNFFKGPLLEALKKVILKTIPPSLLELEKKEKEIVQIW